MAPQLKVRQRIVLTIAVLMMDVLVAAQFSIYGFCHYETMLRNVALSAGHRMFRHVDEHVAATIQASTALPAASFVSTEQTDVMSVNKAQRMSLEHIQSCVVSGCYSSVTPATAFTKTARRSPSIRRQRSPLAGSVVMPVNESRRVIAMMFLRDYRLATTAFAKGHVEHLNMVMV